MAAVLIAPIHHPRHQHPDDSRLRPAAPSEHQRGPSAHRDRAARPTGRCAAARRPFTSSAVAVGLLMALLTVVGGAAAVSLAGGVLSASSVEVVQSSGVDHAAPSVVATTAPSASGTDRVGAVAVADGTTQIWIVRPGDSLWSIAATVAPDSDPRPIVDELSRRLGGAELQPGQRISLDGLDR
ncbi:MAG: hypothetical protein JJU45_10700 [Acidimicrobiia bacterium]|nr:hypothetical protein [Acidimicrobiia bacterium]